MLKKTLLAVSLALTAAAQAAPTQLLGQPTLSANHLAFVHGGDLWIAARDGSLPRRLTSHAAPEFAPRFSPDGRHIAYSATIEGNTDVYVLPVQGGTARRLTWHPGPDVVSGWSADGRSVLFASPREVLNGRSNQLYEVPLEGGFERKLMEAQAFEGRWSPDGKQLAFRPWRAAHGNTAGWRRHRGGSTPPIWVIEPATQRWFEIPHTHATDHSPVWVGRTVVFISDRSEGAANLFAFDTQTQTLRQLTHETVWDVSALDAQGQTLVYAVGGQLKTLELGGGVGRTLAIELPVEGPRPQWKDAGRALTSALLSTSGRRLLVSARGEVFSLPIKDGAPRNLTQSSGVREKDALWSPDGQRVAYLSDAPGRRHQLVLRGQTGEGAAETRLLPADDYFTLLRWSPDGQRLLLQDQRLNLYSLALNQPGSTLQKIATTPRRGSFDAEFSPDGRFVAFVLRGANHLGRIWLHELATGRQVAVTDPLVHAEAPVFSRKGEWLFFSASTNAGPTRVGLDMSTQERPLRAGLYAAVLAADGASPLPPKLGDEETPKTQQEPKADAKPEPKPEPKLTRVDLEGLAQRIVALPVAERDNEDLAVSHEGSLWFLDRRQPGVSRELGAEAGPPPADLYRFDFEERKAKLVRAGVQGFSLSGDGKKLLIQAGRGKLEIAEASDKLDAKPIDLAALRTRIDPRAEWQQIFDETWWMQKAFFYDPALHGLDWEAVYRRYRPLLAFVARREDLNDLLMEMIGELQVGHNRVGGGDVYSDTRVPVGLLGADFGFEHGRWRLKAVLQGDPWNPSLRAPLAQPGQAARVGEYLLAVNGQELGGTTNLYQLLEHQVGQPVSLTLASDPAGQQGRRQLLVQPIASEAALRQWTWVERNRQQVEKLSGGRIAYVYLPDTAGGGFSHFNRMFFAQSDKPALIVDDRRNSGGQAANYVTELLGRPHLGSWKDRDGLLFHTPGSAIDGPKAMLIDQDAGSGGDFLPYAFKRLGLGPLIGKRTWGGLIGISANPPLIDGGALVVPYFRFFTPEGEWRIENEGVAPDQDVNLDPAAVNAGRDPQLEAAVADVLKRLAGWKSARPEQAPAPAALGR